MSIRRFIPSIVVTKIRQQRCEPPSTDPARQPGVFALPGGVIPEVSWPVRVSWGGGGRGRDRVWWGIECQQPSLANRTVSATGNGNGRESGDAPRTSHVSDRQPGPGEGPLANGIASFQRETGAFQRRHTSRRSTTADGQLRPVPVSGLAHCQSFAVCHPQPR